MTVYRATRYEVGGQLAHGGEVETHYDPMPATVTQVWDYEGDPWTRVGDEWLPVEPEYGSVPWEELLEDFGPVTDEEHHSYWPECPHCLLELVDELHLRGHLP